MNRALLWLCTLFLLLLAGCTLPEQYNETQEIHLQEIAWCSFVLKIFPRII